MNDHIVTSGVLACGFKVHNLQQVAGPVWSDAKALGGGFVP